MATTPAGVICPRITAVATALEFAQTLKTYMEPTQHRRKICELTFVQIIDMTKTEQSGGRSVASEKDQGYAGCA